MLSQALTIMQTIVSLEEFESRLCKHDRDGQMFLPAPEYFPPNSPISLKDCVNTVFFFSFIKLYLF